MQIWKMCAIGTAIMAVVSIALSFQLMPWQVVIGESCIVAINSILLGVTIFHYVKGD